MRYEAPGAEQLVEILVYEGSKIFKDRLVDLESKQNFDQILFSSLK